MVTSTEVAPESADPLMIPDGACGVLVRLVEGDDAEGLHVVGIFADVVGDGEGGLAEFGGEDGGGARFLVGEFRGGVQVFVDFEQIRELGVDSGG
jgi:hypothetical protein